MLPLLLALSTLLPPTCPPRACESESAEDARIRDHFAGALAELSTHDTRSLTSAQRAARAARLADLAAYAEAGVFPRNREFDDRRMPTFIDVDGTYCAMAWLLAADGEDALAHRVAATDLNVFVGDMGLDPGLGDWLDRNGLTLAEATRIQPTYEYHRDAAECVCDCVWANLEGFDPSMVDSDAVCPDGPLKLSDFDQCPPYWPGYPNVPPPRLTQAQLDRMIAGENCFEVLYAADVRWRYDVDKNSTTEGCSVRPGRVTAPAAFLLLPWFFPGFLRWSRRRRRQRSARPKSTSPSSV